MSKISLAIALVCAGQSTLADVKITSTSANQPATFSPQFEQEFFPKFAQCDMSFFKWLKQNKSQLDGIVPLVDKKDSAVFAVVKQDLLANEDDEEEFDEETLERLKELYGDEKYYHIAFERPISVNGVQLTGYYFQEKDPESFYEDDYQKGMKAYFWGFTTAEPTLQRTVRKLHQLKLTGDGDTRMSDTYLIADVRKSSKWVASELAFGVAPKPNTVEKNIFVSGSLRPTIECSVQGVVSAKLLKTLHPELD